MLSIVVEVTRGDSEVTARYYSQYTIVPPKMIDLFKESEICSLSLYFSLPFQEEASKKRSKLQGSHPNLRCETR